MVRRRYHSFIYPMVPGTIIKFGEGGFLKEVEVWRQRVASWFAEVPGVPPRVYRPWHLAPIPRRAIPSLLLCNSRPVVDRTVGACPITFSSRHLTSNLFHSYISTTHSLRPQACIISFCFLGQYRLRAWGSEDNEIVTGIFSSYTSRPGPRLTLLKA